MTRITQNGYLLKNIVILGALFYKLIIKISLMKLTRKTKITMTKKTMNLTTKVSDVIKSLNKKPGLKNTTVKLTKTTKGRTINPKSNVMTEDDIDRLFNSQSKVKQTKQTGCLNTKISVEGIDNWGGQEPKDFLHSIKFLKMDNQWDKLLTGLPLGLMDQITVNQLFMQSHVNLTAKFKADYQVGKIIGEGAYASVRIAIYRPLNKTVAIKVYQKSKIQEPQRKKSIRREIRILQMLNHPNIVKIFNVVETNNHLNIVMEYLDGVSLGRFLKQQRGHRIAEKKCKKIFRQLGQALKYMHSLNIAHRDIKLQNIILDENNSPKFIDFGFSTCIQPSKKVKIFCGTPSYMAPEVVQKNQHRGQTADVWAFGVLMFVTLTGIFPFQGSSDQQLYQKINTADYPKKQLILNKNLSDLIGKMFIVQPENRITISEVLKHPWFSTTSSRSDSNKKKTEQNSLYNFRKRINTVESIYKESKPKTTKKILSETCKENLNLQLRKALKSPTYKHTNLSKKNANKQNTLKNFKSEKATYRQFQNIAPPSCKNFMKDRKPLKKCIEKNEKKEKIK